jgi:thioredoxin 1
MYLPTCPHCQKMRPVVSAVAKETKGKYKIGKADMSTNPDLGTKYSVESVPAFIFFKDGKEVGRLIGEQSKDALLAKLQEASK